MSWKNILKAEAEAEAKLNEVIKVAETAYKMIEELRDFDTSAPENFIVHPETGKNVKIVDPNSYQGQRLKLDGVINMLKKAHRNLLDVQIELRKPAEQQPIDAGTGQPINWDQSERVE